MPRATGSGVILRGHGRRWRQRCLGLLVVCAWAACATDSAPRHLPAPRPSAPVKSTDRVRAPERPPDVVVVLIDTLRTDHLSLHGYDRPTSPELVAFAQVATDYRRAYAQAPWTAPSVASLMTSRYPREVGVRDAPAKLALETRTLAAVLRQHGYRTEAVSTNILISKKYGYDVGFDRFVELYLSRAPSIPTSRLVTDSALSAAREASEAQPLFLYVHYFDPHYDYLVHPGFRRFEPGLSREDVILREAAPFHYLRAKFARDLDERRMVEARAYYDSDIEFTDHHVGRLLSGLRGLRRFDNAVIVIVADHGEEFLDHGEIGHSVALYDELLHVPLLIKAPFQTRGDRQPLPVALLDVAPTILDLAGLPPEPTHRGASLRTAGPARPIFASTFRPSPKVALVQGRFKAVLDRDAHDFELFDLLADPHEQHSLARERPTLAGMLRFQLERWDEGEFLGTTSTPATLTEDERALLRALGYGD